MMLWLHSRHVTVTNCFDDLLRKITRDPVLVRSLHVHILMVIALVLHFIEFPAFNALRLHLTVLSHINLHVNAKVTGMTVRATRPDTLALTSTNGCACTPRRRAAVMTSALTSALGRAWTPRRPMISAPISMKGLARKPRRRQVLKPCQANLNALQTVNNSCVSSWPTLLVNAAAMKLAPPSRETWYKRPLVSPRRQPTLFTTVTVTSIMRSVSHYVNRAIDLPIHRAVAIFAFMMRGTTPCLAPPTVISNSHYWLVTNANGKLAMNTRRRPAPPRLLVHPFLDIYT